MASQYYHAINAVTNEILFNKVRIARDFTSRSIGLLNRIGLEDDEGLLIDPCNSIHMFFMKFPIDVLFLAKNGKILKINHSLMPWRLSSCFLAKNVLEVKAGAIKKNRLNVGDFVKFQ